MGGGFLCIFCWAGVLSALASFSNVGVEVYAFIF